ncbi:UdgX family uracil-DNA binding protein [Plastoroseomonas arctica]|uniref:Type-4 uracil-DNA glycosylase n=1 Tax=Plastoroseomonas arctica TaxID=1509237 RepID=A0AAF1K039_9PROT|nr:UdgX family uracil-DNA binding protein [Plastoroseomonas arctica]MBR0657430.1 UdgX family uracil-DNA binding protein [Plastoroseomonas arctica]
MAYSVVLAGPVDIDGWRAAARDAWRAGISPDRLVFHVPGEAGDLFGGEPPPPPRADAAMPLVPRDFLALAEVAVRHRDPARFALLYDVLCRIAGGARGLLDDAADPVVARLRDMAKAVRRDAHKMHAFVRFTEIEGPRHVAWFEPDHYIEEAEAGFFIRRFAQLRWSIATPRLSLHWDGAALSIGPAGRRDALPPPDAGEALWRAYFGAIFNPARLKPAAMRAEMPEKYWKNLPEAQDIPRLIAEAPSRVRAMVAAGAAAPNPNPQRRRTPMATSTEGFAELRAQLLAADLPEWASRATQPVMGEGPVGAALMLVGEQPGDEEDLAGRAFVGPAGRLLNAVLEEAEVPRDALFVTNAVKHFKYTQQGRRRLHQTPDAGDITRYRPFLRAEVALVRPRLVLALGATALRALTGRAMPVTKSRDLHLKTADGMDLRATVHPSYLLRLPDAVAQRAERQRFAADLARAYGEATQTGGAAHAGGGASGANRS